jgi:hypothetical protein
MADAGDLKSSGLNGSCGFDSRPGHPCQRQRCERSLDSGPPNSCGMPIAKRVECRRNHAFISVRTLSPLRQTWQTTAQIMESVSGGVYARRTAEYRIRSGWSYGISGNPRSRQFKCSRLEAKSEVYPTEGSRGDAKHVSVSCITSMRKRRLTNGTIARQKQAQILSTYN